MVLFPEGTCTNGKYILPFKKGAFFSLLNVKPVVINSFFEDDSQLGVGSSSLALNWIKSLGYLTSRISYSELPVIRPTDYMFEKYGHLGKEKWMVYAEVVRRIYAEVTGYKLSDKGLKDNIKYENSMLDGVYKEEEPEFN